MGAIVLAFAAIAASPPRAKTDFHEQENALYRELRSPGIAVGAKGTSRVPLPEPTMPDGLGDDAQKAIVAKIIAGIHPIEEFLRDDVEAPFVVTVAKLDPVERGTPIRRFSVWFVAHGTLDAVVEQRFRKRFANISRGEVVCQELNPSELASRKLDVKDSAIEFYTNYNIPLFDRVQLSETKHNIMTRSPESVVVASLLDPRFLDDLTYPNQWQTTHVEKNGDVVFGAPQRYTGAASYLKLTALAGPARAIFGEFHVAYTEPAGWFEGTNFMRSKIPILAREEIKGFRRELARAKRDVAAGTP